MPNCQQFELYGAEADVPQGRTIASGDALQGYVDSLAYVPYVARNFAMVERIDAVSLKRGSASVGGFDAATGIGRVDMLPVHHVELFILHEVAHVYASARYSSRAHDPWFARTYLELVYEVMGSDAYAALFAAFERDGIDHDTDSSVPGGIAL